VMHDERGAVLHMLRADSPVMTGFGEIYFSEINPGVVKAWKRHHRMTQRLTVPVGRVRFVIFDDRTGSSSRGRLVEIDIGRPELYRLLVIPPLVWYGWKNLAATPSLVANCADLPHEPGEAEQSERVPGMPEYRW